MIKLACCQFDVSFGNTVANLSRAVTTLDQLSKSGVNIVVFPEAFLTGYCVETQEDARKIAIPASSLGYLQQAVNQHDMVCVVGFAEFFGEKIYNSAAILEANKPVRIYRKSHLPDLGLDKFVTAGDELTVFDTKFGRLGVLICYDLRPPEATRVLALQGAELLILPTNWPEGAQVSADHIAIARAAENRIFVATCNRVGEENGFRFIGLSKIIAPTGEILTAAAYDETILVASLDLAQARQKRTVTIPGKYEVDVFACRNPDLYKAICERTVPT